MCQVEKQIGHTVSTSDFFIQVPNYKLEFLSGLDNIQIRGMDPDPGILETCMIINTFNIVAFGITNTFNSARCA